MSMNLSALQTMVSYLVDDLQLGYFTQAQLLVFINNGQREVQKRLLQTPGNWYVERVNTPTVQFQSDYALPSDFLKIHRVELVLSGTPPNEVKGPLDAITINETDQLPPGPGTPSCYWTIQNTLSIYPAPDTANQTLRLYYSYLVADMVNPTDIPNVPNQYQELIAWFAIRNCFTKDQRDPAPVMAEIAIYEAMMKQDSQQRDVSRGRRIVSTEGSSSYTSAY